MEGKQGKITFWIAETAIFLALLIGFQFLSAALGQFVTGSLVNLILIMAVLMGGVWSGLTIAALSPVFAFLLGIGPALPPLIPLIMMGNVSIVLVWHFIATKIKIGNDYARYGVAVVAGAVVKFAVLYVCIVHLLLPALNLPEKQMTAMSLAFSWPQLVTAAIGGAVATAIAPTVLKIINKTREPKEAAQ